MKVFDFAFAERHRIFCTSEIKVRPHVFHVEPVSRVFHHAGIRYLLTVQSRVVPIRKFLLRQDRVNLIWFQGETLRHDVYACVQQSF